MPYLRMSKWADAEQKATSSGALPQAPDQLVDKLWNYDDEFVEVPTKQIYDPERTAPVS